MALGCGGDDGPPTGPPGGTGEPAAIEVTPRAVSLHALGDSARLATVVRDADGDAIAGAAVTWASGDTAVATVDPSGRVVAQGNGTVDIVASSGGLADTASVEVAQVAGIVTVGPVADTLAQGDTLRLSATVADSNGFPLEAPPTVAWTSANETVIEVDSTGLATAVRGGGEAVVSASVDGVEGHATIRVLDRIAFNVTLGNAEIYVINEDGSGLTNLTANDSADFHPTWSPDGTRIAFVSDREFNPNELYVMNADGTGVIRLTLNAAFESWPAWRPRP